MRIKVLGWAVLFLAACPIRVHAVQEVASVGQVQEVQTPAIPTTKLVLHPAKMPTPALKYPLLPPAHEIRPGNAALLYQRAQNLEWWSAVRKQGGRMEEFLAKPLSKTPKADFALDSRLLKEVDLAARRDQCDWDLLTRVHEEGPNLPLPALSFQFYALSLGVRARLEMLEKKTDQAVYTLQTGFALSRHVADGPTLMNGFRGISIAQNMAERVEDLIQLPSTPNLFWSLADLPRPFVDLRRPLLGERLSIDALFPDIREALIDPNAPPASVARLSRSLGQEVFEGSGSNVARNKALLTVLVSKGYPAARKYLLDQGRMEKDIDELPVLQVVTMHYLAQFDRVFDEAVKWQNLPYWQAHAGLRKATEALGQPPQQMGGLYHPRILVSTLDKLFLFRTQLDRRLAALQVVEALRLYAADNRNKLPARLLDIRDLPLPVDPVTGKAFEYKLEGNRAVLSGPASSSERYPNERSSIRYEITIAPTP